MNQTGAVLYFEKSLELSDVILLNGTQIQRNVEDKLDLPHIQMTQNDRFALVERLKCVPCFIPLAFLSDPFSSSRYCLGD